MTNWQKANKVIEDICHIIIILITPVCILRLLGYERMVDKR